MYIPRAALLACLLVSSLAVHADPAPKTTEELKREVQAKIDSHPHRDTLEASVFRGNIVFLNYCTTCHGVNADGTGRAAKMYNPKPANLRTSMMPDMYKDMIIRRGGKAMGRSEFMPPWSDELTNEQIRDTVSYLRAIAPANAPK